MGGADDIWVQRSVEDGCSYQQLPVSGLIVSARDTSVASTFSSPGVEGATVVPRRPGRTWIVLDASELVDSVRVEVPDTFAMGDVSAIAAGGSTTCAVEAAERILCWGDNYTQLLGGQTDPAIGTCRGAPCSPMPKPVAWNGHSAFIGGQLACFLDSSGATCTPGSPTEFFADPELVSFTFGLDHTCGVGVDGTAYCWGFNHVGQLGSGPVGSYQPSPYPIARPDTWVSMGARDASTCGATAAGELYCWGILPGHVPGVSSCETSPGGKGGGPTYAFCSAEPLRIGLGAGADPDTLAAQVSGLCVLTTEGGVLCAREGALSFSRVAAPGSFVQLRAGGAHFCGLAMDGTARCWGDNWDGQLGTGGRAFAATPRLVEGGLAFSDLALGESHSCGLTVARDVWCWGTNHVGQAGVSILDTALVPTRVRGQGAP
jgi:alpha-tubulin suppressor-like RCC1 family protein